MGQKLEEKSVSEKGRREAAEGVCGDEQVRYVYLFQDPKLTAQSSWDRRGGRNIYSDDLDFPARAQNSYRSRSRSRSPAMSSHSKRSSMRSRSRSTSPRPGRYNAHSHNRSRRSDQESPRQSRSQIPNKRRWSPAYYRQTDEERDFPRTPSFSSVTSRSRSRSRSRSTTNTRIQSRSRIKPRRRR